ncbi:intradiol ring-cleavage dioxygenase [Tsuneonella sp. HG222]
MPDTTSQLRLDSAATLHRRGALGLLGLGGLALGACSSGAQAASCILTPRETRGPFPADGGRDQGGRLNVLEAEGIERSDIRSSFAGLSGVAAGVPLELTIDLIGAAGGCGPLAGWGLYLWQNDAAGKYSLYDLPQANYLRGLQQSGDTGSLTFRTILPGCYGGRAPHVHFEVFSSAQAAISGEPHVLASQFAFPEDVCRAVYAADERYGDSLANLGRWPAVRDFVFGDADEEMLVLQTIALDGDPRTGLTGRARVNVNG